LQLTVQDRCLNIMPLFHIHGLMAAVLASMSAEAGVACTPGFYTPRFFEWLEAFMPTWYTAVPSMHKAILARASDNEDIAKCVQMRFVRSSPASLPPQVLGVASDPNEAAHWQLVSFPVAEDYIVALAVRGIPSLQARYLEML
jgi:acyl-CoA synthetase (AMP-forming)/AMP-acid ligase II